MRPFPKDSSTHLQSGFRIVLALHPATRRRRNARCAAELRTARSSRLRRNFASSQCLFLRSLFSSSLLVGLSIWESSQVRGRQQCLQDGKRFTSIWSFTAALALASNSLSARPSLHKLVHGPSLEWSSLRRAYPSWLEQLLSPSPSS